MKKFKPLLVLLLKILVSAGLLIYFFTRIHIERFVQTFATADPSYIALTLIVYLASQIVGVVRWMILARPLGFKTSFKALVYYYLIGMFFNLFAPGTVGGDVSRIYYLARDSEQNVDKKWGGATMHAAVSVFIDRVIGMAVLVWLGAVGLFLYPQYAIPATVRLVTFALAGGFILGGLLLPVLRRVLPADGHPVVVKLRVALRGYRAHWQAIPQAILLSLVVHFVQAWIHMLLGRAIHIDIPYSFCIILYPLVGTFSALPVSLNGLGLREGGYLYLFQFIGVRSEKGIAFGLLLFAIVAVDSLVGGLLFLVQKGSNAASQSSELRNTRVGKKSPDPARSKI
jgi:glycosyltransferase 2 family protein